MCEIKLPKSARSTPMQSGDSDWQGMAGPKLTAGRGIGQEKPVLFFQSFQDIDAKVSCTNFTTETKSFL